MDRQTIVLVGDYSLKVGRTALASKFCNNLPPFSDEHNKEVIVDGVNTSLVIVDYNPNNSDEYSPLRDAHLRLPNGFLAIYSIDKEDSFTQLEEFCFPQILRVKDYETNWIPMVIVGNKCDLEEARQVSTEQGMRLAEKWKCPFFETSVSMAINVDDIFVELIRVIRKAQPKDCQIQQQVGQKKNCTLSWVNATRAIFLPNFE